MLCLHEHLNRVKILIICADITTKEGFDFMDYLDLTNLTIDSIPALASTMAQTNVLESVGTAMLGEAISSSAADMSELTKAMELSVNPDIGSNIDYSV